MDEWYASSFFMRTLASLKEDPVLVWLKVYMDYCLNKSPFSTLTKFVFVDFDCYGRTDVDVLSNCSPLRWEILYMLFVLLELMHIV